MDIFIAYTNFIDGNDHQLQVTSENVNVVDYSLYNNLHESKIYRIHQIRVFMEMYHERLTKTRQYWLSVVMIGIDHCIKVHYLESV